MMQGWTKEHFVNKAATRHEFLIDMDGHYIVPLVQLMPLYGAWKDELKGYPAQWALKEDGMPATSYDARDIAALIETYLPHITAHVREIGPDGLPVPEDK